MTEIFCLPPALLPARPGPDQQLFSLFHATGRPDAGSIGRQLINQVSKSKFRPDARAWDFLAIALGVIAADTGVLRSNSPDGWTRKIDLTVAVIDTDFWVTQTVPLQDALAFLTGDVWALRFVETDEEPEWRGRVEALGEDCVSLLSGGLDSLVGAIDLADQGRNPLVVSQLSRGDKTSQKLFARTIGGTLRHFQANHMVEPPEGSERSQRARSIIFLAYGVLAATSLDRYGRGERVELIVPENGFISLNIPLTALRVGSLSTRTTHPVFLQQVQAILNVAQLRVDIVNPYQFQTKGQMLVNCRNQALLTRLAGSSTSCGRFLRYGYTHCSKCVPCLIRRASFLRWQAPDPTRYANGLIADAEDVRATAIAVRTVQQHGIDYWASPFLSTAQLGNVAQYLQVCQDGIGELQALLAGAGIR